MLRNLCFWVVVAAVSFLCHQTCRCSAWVAVLASGVASCQQQKPFVLPLLSLCSASNVSCMSRVFPAELIRHLPLAKDVVLSARQELVMRLDGYCEANLELFNEVGRHHQGWQNGFPFVHLASIMSCTAYPLSSHQGPVV